MRERLKLAQELLKLSLERLKPDPSATWKDVVDASQRVLKAELELSPNKAAGIASHQRHVRMTEELARLVDGLIQVGVIHKRDGRLAQYLLIDAKIGLERERARK